MFVGERKSVDSSSLDFIEIVREAVGLDPVVEFVDLNEFNKDIPI